MTSATDQISDADALRSAELSPHDAHAVNTNDARRFVYHWISLFEHRAPAEHLAAHLTESQPLSLTFPGAEPMHEVEQFTGWYEALLANTRWNFHELSHLIVEAGDRSTFSVAFDIDWHGAVTDDSTWPTNQPANQFHFELRQRWQVATHPGDALDDPFFIANLVAEPRQQP